LEAAKALAANLPTGRAEADRIDASNVDTMVEAFAGSMSSSTSFLPRFNLGIMEACLKARVHYVDAATDLALAKEKAGRDRRSASGSRSSSSTIPGSEKQAWWVS